MRNVIFFLVFGTLVTLLLIAVCSTVCALIVIALAKIISPRILVVLPFSIIGGMLLSFFFYGKIMKKIMNKLDLNNRKK